MRHPLIFWHSLFLFSLVLFITLVALLRRGIEVPSGEKNDEFAHFLNTSFKGKSFALPA
jgi:hypothetical protein